MPKIMNQKWLVNQFLKEYDKNATKNTVDNSIESRQNAILEAEMSDTYMKIAQGATNRAARQKKYTKFIVESKQALLEECIYRLFDASLIKTTPDPNMEKTARALVHNFVEEQGTEDLLRRFETASELLSEFAFLVNKYHQLIKESIDKDNEETFKIDSNLTDKFYEDLDCVNADEVVYSIRNRVADAMNDFIDQNTADKMEIKQILKDTQDQINIVKDADNGSQIQEGYSIIAKQKISKIQNNRPRSIFECMVRTLDTKAHTDEKYKNIYFEGTNINMDKVVDNARFLYTFLETINTSKMVDVNGQYIQEVLSDINA